MKLLKLSALPVLILSLLIFNSCEEILNEVNICSFSYGALSFTKGPPNQTQEISPDFARGTITGQFTSSPTVGLALNQETGVIDVNASDPGEYTITHEGEISCETQIVILEGEQECELRYVYKGEVVNSVLQGEVDYLLARVNDSSEPVESGRFYATPAGLAISETNGAIDVAASESGIEYTIYYELREENVFCQTQVTIAGVNYEDQKVTLNTEEEAIVSPQFIPDNFEGNDLIFSSPDESLEINEVDGSIDLIQTLINIDLADNQELDRSFINLEEIGFTRKFIINYQVRDFTQSLEIQLFWFPDEEYQGNPDLADLVEVFEGKGIPVNGKIEQRPPYILTIGDYER